MADKDNKSKLTYHVWDKDNNEYDIPDEVVQQRGMDNFAKDFEGGYITMFDNKKQKVDVPIEDVGEYRKQGYIWYDTSGNATPINEVGKKPSPSSPSQGTEQTQYPQEVIDAYNSPDNKPGNFKDLAQLNGEYQRGELKKPSLISQALGMMPKVDAGNIGREQKMGGMITSMLLGGNEQQAQPMQQPQDNNQQVQQTAQGNASQEQKQEPAPSIPSVVNDNTLMDAKFANYLEDWKKRPDKEGNYFENFVADLEADGMNPDEALEATRSAQNRYANRSAIEVTNKVVSALADDTVQDAEKNIEAQWYSHDVQDKFKQEASAMGISYDDYVAYYLKPSMVESLVQKYGQNNRNIAEGIATRLYSHDEHVQDRLMNQDINDALSDVISKYVNPSVVDEYNKAQEAGSKAFNEGMEGSQNIPASLRLGTAIASQYEANQAKDPQKTLYTLQKKFNGLYKNPQFLNDMSNAAFKVMLRYGMNGTLSGNPKQFKPMIDEVLKAQLNQLEVKNMIPKGSLEYIMNKGLGNTIVGKITRKLVQTDYQNWLEDIANQQYHPGFWERVGSGALTFAGDAWSYWLPGAAGGKVTKSMLAKAEGRLASDLMAKGMEAKMAERAAKVLIGKSKGMALKTGAAHGAVTFGGQSAISKPIDEIYRTGQLDENGKVYNPSVGKILANTLGEVAKQSAIGAIMQGGTIANMVGKGRGLATNVLADVGGKVVDSSIMTGQQMLERMAHDPNFKPTGKDFAESALESMANLVSIGFPGMVGKYARFKDAKEFNRKFDFNDQDIAELKRFGYDDLRDAFEKLGINGYRAEGEGVQMMGQLTDKYMNLMNDKSVPEVLKAKMMAVVEGKRPSSFSPVIDSIIVQPMDNDGKVYLEILNKDGGIIDRKEYSSLEEAQKAEKKLDFEKSLNITSEYEKAYHTDALQDRLNTVYEQARDRYAAGEQLNDEDKAAIYLHQNASAIGDIMQKQQKGMELTEQEQQMVNSYRHFYDSAFENSPIMKEYVRTFEDSQGVEHGTLRKALEGDGKSRTAEQQKLVEEYQKQLYNDIVLKREMNDAKEQMNQNLIEGQRELPGATQEGGASAQNAEATAEKLVDASVSSDVPPTEPPTPPVGGETPTNVEGTPSVENGSSPSDATTASNESKSDAYVMGQNAYQNGDAEGLKAIDHNDDVSKARLKRAFADNEAMMDVVVKAYEEGKDMEQFVAQRANSMTPAQQDAVRKYVEAQDAKKGVYDALQHADDGYGDALKELLWTYQTEDGNIVPATLTTGQQVFLKKANEYGGGFVVVPDEDGNPAIKQVSSAEIKEVGTPVPMDDYINQQVTEQKNARQQQFFAQYDGSGLKPSDTVEVAMEAGEEPMQMTFAGYSEDGKIVLSDGKDNIALTKDEFNTWRQNALDASIGAELDAEDAQRANDDAAKAEADKKQRYNEGIVGLGMGQPDYSSKDTEPKVAADYLQEQYGEDHGKLLNLVNGSREDIKTQLDNKKKAAAEYQNWLDTNADLDPEKAKKVEDELSLVNEQIADLDARFKNWNTIRNSVMTPDEVKAMTEERKAEVEKAGVDETAIVPSDDFHVLVLDDKELKKQYPTMDKASDYITSQRKDIYHTQEDVEHKLNDVNDMLEQYINGETELDPTQLMELNTTKAQLEALRTNLSVAAKGLKAQANKLSKLYKTEVSQQEMEELGMTPSEQRKVLVSDAIKKNDLGAIKEIYKDASVDVTDLTPQTLEEAVSESLSPHSLNPESLQYELGKSNFKFGIGKRYDSNKFNYLIAKKGTGMSVNEFAVRVFNDLPVNLQDMGYTDQDVRNTLLDMFKSYDNVKDMRNVALMNRIAAAEEELSAEEEWYEAQKEREIIERQAEIEEYNSYIQDKTLSLPSESELNAIEGMEYDRMMEAEEREREYKEYVKSILPEIADYDDRSNEEGYGGGGGLGSDSSRRGVDEGNRQGEEISGREASSESEIGEGSDSGRKGRQETGSLERGEGSVVRGAHLPQEASFGERLKNAIAETEPNPSEAQKKAGNYKKGHLSFGGYDFTVETPKGTTRSGKDEQGKPWSVTMHDTYGYILGKIGVDGDHIDMFINDAADLDSFDGNVYVVDQVNPETGEFDEHKVMFGYPSEESATEAYLANYSKGWKGLGKVTAVPKATFDKWLESSDRKTKPFADYAMIKKGAHQDFISDMEYTYENDVHPSEEDKPKMQKFAERLLDFHQDREDKPEYGYTMLSSNINGDKLYPSEKKWFGTKKYRQGVSWVDKENACAYELNPRFNAQGYLTAVGVHKIVPLASFYRDVKDVKPSEMTEAQKVAFDAVSTMLKKAGIPVKVISNEEMEKVAEAQDNLNLAMLLNQPEMRFKIKTPEEKQAAENAYNFAKDLRPNKWAQYAVVDMSNPNKMPEYYQKQELARKERTYLNRLMWGNYKVFNLDKSFEDNVAGLTGSFPSEFDPYKIDGKGAGVRFLRTYHGTGASFDKFDLSHALEGEGSESFGHGVYVTNSSKIGREYAQRAKQRKMEDLYKNMRYPDGVKGDIFKRRVFGEMVNDVATGGSVASAKEFAKKRVGADVNDIQRTLENLKDREKGTEYEQNLKNRLAEYKEGLKWIDSLDEDYLTQGNANRYDVDIPDDNGSNYLDWEGTIPDSLDKQKVAEDAYKVVSANQGFNDFKATPLNDFIAHTLKTYVNTTDVAGRVDKLKSDIKDVIENYVADDDVLALNEYLKDATPDDVLATIWYNDLVRDIKDADLGEELYRKLSTYVGDNAASQILSDNGLVGIKYPAGMIHGGAKEGDYNYVIFDENNANIVGNTKFAQGKGVVYGYTDGKEIVLNQDHLNANTPIHEYQHLWRTAAKEMNPELIAHGDELIKQTQLFRDLKEDPNYKHLSDDEICDEAFARLTGEDGAAILEQMAKEAIKENPLDTAKELTIINRLKNWLKKFWYWTLDTFTKWKPEDIKKMTLEDIRNLVLRDLAQGVDPRTVMNEKKEGAKLSNKEKDDATERIDKRIAELNRQEKEQSLKSDNGNLAESHDNGYLPSKDNLDGVQSVAPSSAKIDKKFPTKTFYLGNLANFITSMGKNADITAGNFTKKLFEGMGMTPHGKDTQVSEYFKYQTDDGGKTTVRLSDHSGNALSIIKKGGRADKGYSIVVRVDSSPKTKFKANKYSNVAEYVYENPNADGLKDIARSVFNLIDTGEYLDLAGANEVHVSPRNNDADKTLAGVHNITEEKLRKALKLGGLANPSLAVIDTSKSAHDNFGEISFIAPSALVDKRTGKTGGTWITDAYTQRYPSVEREMSEKGYRKFKDWVASLDYPSGAKAEIERQAKDALSDNNAPAWELMYLKEKGIDIKEYDSNINDYRWKEIISDHPTAEDILNSMKTDPELNKKVTSLAKYAIIRPTMDKISLEVRRKIYKETGVKKSPISPIVRQQTKEIFERDYKATLLNKDGSPRKKDVKKVVEDIVKEHNDTKKYDFYLSKVKASNYVNKNGLYDDYIRWQENKLDEFGTKNRIFRGYTKDGSRKYVPETLENVSKAMREDANGQTNGSEYTSFGSFIAKLASRVDSTDEMRANKDKLSSNKDKEEFYEKWESVYYDLAKSLYNDVFYGEQRLHDIVSQADPKKYAKKEYGITLSSSFMKKLDSLKNAVQNDLKSAYFETKFNRPVHLNEFVAAVVPNNLGEDVRKGLEESGLSLYDYDPEKEGDRKRAFGEAVNNEKNVRFMFAGEKGAAEADKAEEKTYRMDNLKVAEKMERGKKDAKTIKLATGWERGADGKWRYEMPDFKADKPITVDVDIDISHVGPYSPYKEPLCKLSDLIDDKNLFAAYPSLKNIDILLVGNTAFEGMYDKLHNNIALRTNAVSIDSKYSQPSNAKEIKAALEKFHNFWDSLTGEDKELADDAIDAYGGYTEEELKEDSYFRELEKGNPKVAELVRLGNSIPSKKDVRFEGTQVALNHEGKLTLAHEIQHAIQDIEGFAEGGNPEQFQDPSELESQYATFDELVKDKFGNNDAGTVIGIINGSTPEYQQFRSEFGKSWDEYFKNLKGMLGMMNGDEKLFKENYDYYVNEGRKKSAFEQYQSLAGEVEARNVMKRMWMTPEERRNSLASETEDVNRDEQIVMNGNNASYSIVKDPETIKKLDKEDTVKVYRAMQVGEDGKLYPPMAAKVKGKFVEPIELGKWEQADERPELADDKGMFTLNKGNGKSLKAAYNPYLHTSRTPLNDQFSEAQNRPNIVTVEVEVPKSELTSGYKADKAKDAVGEVEWKAGIIQGQLTGKRKVVLSRWDKPVRIVPDSEVADKDGELPEKPKKQPRKGGWLEAVEDILPTLTEKKNGVAPWMDTRLKVDGIDWQKVEKPLYVMGSAYADGKIPHAYGDEILPTLRTKSGDVIIMPGGKVLRADGRVLARITGLGDDYLLPKTESLAHTIIGNGIPVQLTKGVIAPLLNKDDLSGRNVLARLGSSIFKNNWDADMQKQVSDRVVNTANKLGGAEATVYTSVDEVPDAYLSDVKNGATGWYDPTTHTVHVYLPNCADANEAERTVLHEKIGHEGMEVLLGGEQGVRKFADFVYKSVDKKTRGKILDFAHQYDPGWNNPDRINIGTQEYIAHLAEEGPTTAEDFSLWTKIKHYLIKVLKKLGIRVPGLLNDKDLRYYLMKAGKALHVWDNMPKEKQEAMMAQASNAEIKDALADGAGKGKPRQKKGESAIQYMKRVMEWKRWKEAREDKEDPEPPMFYDFDKDAAGKKEWERLNKEWRDSHGLRGEEMPLRPERKEGESDDAFMNRYKEWEKWNDAMGDKENPMPDMFSFEKQKQDEARQKYEDWLTRHELNEQNDADLDLYEGKIYPAETNPEADALEQEVMQDLAEVTSTDVSKEGAATTVKHAVIHRRKNMEEASADDAIYINDVKNSIEKMAESGAFDKLLSDYQGKPNKAEKLAEAIPYIIEAPRRIREIAYKLNSTGVFGEGHIHITPDDVEAIQELRPQLAEVTAKKHTELKDGKEVELFDDMKGATEVASKVADIINGNHEKEPGIVPIDGTDILNKNVLPIILNRITPYGVDYKNLSEPMKSVLDAIRDWYNYTFDWLKDNNTLKADTGFTVDYVNHLWDKEKSDKQAYAMYVENRQRTKSPNEKPRLINTIIEGLEVGLVPKTTDITKMMAYYSRSNIEAWANKTMLQEVSGLNVIERNEDGEIISSDPLLSSVAPFNLEQYKYFEIPGVGPVWVYNVSPKQMKVKNPITGKDKVLYSEASAGDRFGVVFDTYQSTPFWKAFDTLASSMKKLELGFSGFHAGALTEVYMVQNMVEYGPKKALANFMKYIFADTMKNHQLPCFANPQDFQEAATHLVKFGATNDYAAADVQNMFDNFRDSMMKVQEKLKDGNGISGTVALATMPLKVATQMLSLINKGMDRALWDFLHDGLKLATYRMRADKTKERAKKKGWTEEELSRALDEDGQFVNDMFGGQHWDVLGASHRTLRYAGRVLLSPDWNASTTRHFLALTGYGSLWNEATLENFKGYYKRLYHKNLTPEDEGRRARQISSLFCYGLGFMVFYEAIANGINAAFRALDEEKESKKAEELRKTNPNYRSPYELAYPDGMKWYDYLMRGNSLGQQSKIFMGRYADGTEMYIRHGKQFREVPEYLFNHKGELEFPGPMVQRMIGKANPMVRMTLDDINYLSDFQASHADQEIQRKYGKTIGLLYKDALYWAPFLIPSQENKEFKAVDFFFPSSKGFSPWKAQSYFKDFILSGDMEGVVMTYQSCERNGIDPAEQIKAAIGSVKALESAEMKDGITSLQVASERFDEAKSITEKKKMRQKMKKFLSQSDYKAFTQKEALDMVQSYLNGEDDLKEMEKAENKYLMKAKSEDVTEDWRIQAVWNGTMETYDEYLRLKDVDKVKANAFKRSKTNKRLFAARKAISAAKKKMNKAKKQMDGQNDAAKMVEIRKTRKELIETLNGME